MTVHVYCQKKKIRVTHISLRFFDVCTFLLVEQWYELFYQSRWYELKFMDRWYHFFQSFEVCSKIVIHGPLYFPLFGD